MVGLGGEGGDGRKVEMGSGGRHDEGLEGGDWD